MNARPCTFEIWDPQTKTRPRLTGVWHAWSIDFDEFRDSVVNYAVAICETPDGKVYMPRADWVVFTDAAKGGK